MRRLLFTLPLLSACAVSPTPPDQESVELSAQSEALTGGRVAGEAEFPATVSMGGCTGVKVGPHHFMLAAHCVHDAFENGTWWQYQPGGQIWITPDNRTDTGTFRPLTVVQTHVPSSWFDTCVTPCQVNVLNPSHPPDVALVVVSTDSPDIAEAEVDLSPVLPGQPLVMTGYGCENGLDGPFGDFGPRLKLGHVLALPQEALLHDGTYVSQGDEGNVAASYVITSGVAKDALAASLCPGDSGGPLYRDDAGQRTLVGINAYYTFNWSGVAYTNWHTRLDSQARFGIGPWLQGLGVNVLGDGDPCTPTCDGKSCGSDTCGGICGICQNGQTCSGAGQCQCTPSCDGKSCGSDGCGGTCGTCQNGQTCDGAGLCQCTPVCDGKSCGSDGCGGTCGSCQNGQTCNGAGQCEGTTSGCAGVPEWDPSRFNYSIGEKNQRNGRIYECTNNGHCFRDPAGPWGHFGWTLRSDC
jgi:hypothetical protein